MQKTPKKINLSFSKKAWPFKHKLGMETKKNEKRNISTTFVAFLTIFLDKTQHLNTSVALF